MRFEFDQASIKHCALHSDLTSEEDTLRALGLFSSKILFPPKTLVWGYRADSEIMGDTFTVIHMGLIAAFKKNHNILNYRLTVLGQLSLNEDHTMWQLRATRQTWIQISHHHF